MREILFRGKRKDNREWVEGDLLTDGIDYITAIRVHRANELVEGTIIAVIPETVGQYTGLTNKNGNKIFEGDIIKDCVNGVNFEVLYCNFYSAEFILQDKYKKCFSIWKVHFADSEVIGNIHDNPELLEK